MLGPEWSRRLARAMNVSRPDPDLRLRLIRVLERESNANNLPIFFLDFIKESEAREEKKSVSIVLNKAGRDQIDAALAYLDELPDVEPGLLASPWPVATRLDLKDEQWQESVITPVQISELTATQKYLNRKRVEYYVMNPGAIEPGKRALANVYDDGSALLIVDGHHRLAAWWILGVDLANVWMLNDN